jgi:hypothetical protein
VVKLKDLQTGEEIVIAFKRDNNNGMPLKLRPTGLGSGIDKDRQDYTVYTGGWDIGRIYEPAAARSICAGSGRLPFRVR